MSKQLLFILLVPFSMTIKAMDDIAAQIKPSIDEKTAQQQIRSIALRENISDTQAIWKLIFKNPICALVLKNIHRLFDIASDDTKTFSTEDLADTWYVNSTTGFISKTLLFSAFKQGSHQKIHALYKAGFNTPHAQYEKLLIEDAIGDQYNALYTVRPLGSKRQCYNLECIRVLLEYSPETLVEKTFYPTQINVLINEVNRYKYLKESDKVMELVEDNHDILFLFIERICQANCGHIEAIRRDLQALSCANKKWYTYLANEESRKKIIRIIALHKEWNDACTAHTLGYENIHKKIIRLFDIANSSDKFFDENDLKDAWYLNATRTYVRHNIGNTYVKPYGDTKSNQTLLLSSIASHNKEKMILLLNAGINPNHTRVSVHPLLDIVDNYNTQKQPSYQMVQLLLKKGANPNCRTYVTQLTPLAYAVFNNHRGLARLLLRFKANPYLLIYSGTEPNKFCINDTIETYDPKNPHLRNVFCFEQEPKGWFTKMVNEVKENPNAKPKKKQSVKNKKSIDQYY
jgi:hypothetical protein